LRAPKGGKTGGGGLNPWGGLPPMAHQKFAEMVVPYSGFRLPQIACKKNGVNQQRSHRNTHIKRKTI